MKAVSTLCAFQTSATAQSSKFRSRSIKWLTSSANAAQQPKRQHKKIDCPYSGNSIIDFHFIFFFSAAPQHKTVWHEHKYHPTGGDCKD